MLAMLLNKLTTPLFNVIAFEQRYYPLTYKIEKLDTDILLFGKLLIVLN